MVVHQQPASPLNLVALLHSTGTTVTLTDDGDFVAHGPNGRRADIVEAIADFAEAFDLLLLDGVGSA